MSILWVAFNYTTEGMWRVDGGGEVGVGYLKSVTGRRCGIVPIVK